MIKLKVLFLSVIVLSLVFSCSKQKRIQNKISGKWVLEQMRIVDGQGFTYYLDNVEGELDLNFEGDASSGVVLFQSDDVANGQTYSIDFEGELLEIDSDLEVLNLHINQDRVPFSLVLFNSNDLVIEYYDFPNYQLRKFIFTRN
ncbi:MAG: hypothetical protein P8K10_08480 [Crocinitomicaceae bacterium]|nr:hypothetical protein [Crocinitomicaceae bacterium]